MRIDGLWVSLAMLACAVLVTTNAEAVPKKKKPTAEPSSSVPDFDKLAASSALTAITDRGLQKCKVTNTAKGEGHVSITFSPDGAAQNVAIDRGPWIGTPVAKCIQREYKKAKVPAFKGDAVTVGRTFRFE